MRGLHMLNDITGVRFRGANFETLTDVLLLNPHAKNSNKINKSKGHWYMDVMVQESVHWQKR